MKDNKDNNIWKVYIHTSPNNKYYIGITSQTTKRRWGFNGSEYKRNTNFYDDILKYGWNNFSHEVIAENLTRQDACCFEKKLIELLKSNTCLGYNISEGGIGGDRKGKIKVKQYSLDGIYIKTYDGASDAGSSVGIDRTRITNCCKGKSKSACGYMWCYEDKEIKEKYNRLKTSQKTVYQYDLYSVFIKRWECVKDINTELSIPSNSISKCLNNKNKEAYGYFWSYSKL